MNNQQIFGIEIKGYKSIKDCTLKLNMINILIGSNGAGKSNFISVFRLLQDIIEKKLQTHIAMGGGSNAFLYNGAKFTDEIAITFHFGKNFYAFKLKPSDDGRLFFDTESFGYEGGWNHASILGSGHTESKWENGVGNAINSYVMPILKNEKWRVYHFHDTGRSARVKQSHKVHNNAELQFDAGNLAAFLLRLRSGFEKSYINIVSAVKLIAPYFEDFYLQPNDNTDDILLRWKQCGSDDVFNANQFSDGTLRFICLAVLLLQPSELQPETIIIDEPELGLHPYAISVLAELVKSISQLKQIIISTQSVELLNEFDVCDVVVVDRNEESGTKFKRLNEQELSVWLDDEYSLGDLWKKNLIGGRLTT